jgi:GNAT superfamily N-acetyltransferase
VNVRVVACGDAERFRALRLRALADAPEAFTSTLAIESAYPPSRWADWVAGSEAGEIQRIFVAGDFEGMAGGFFHEGRVVLWGMWVAPGARGRGLGRELFGAVAGWARDRGSPVLHLSVLDGAQAGPRELYASFGCVPVGREEDPAQTHLELPL